MVASSDHEGSCMNSSRSGFQDRDSHTSGLSDPSSAPCESCWIVEEADHRIANHLAMLASFVQQKASELSRQPDKLNLEQVQFALQSVRLQVGVTAHLHRTLSSRRRMSRLDFGDHLREISTSFLSLAPGKFELICDISSGCFIGAAKVLPLSSMVAEVLTNAAKYAVSGNRPCYVKVGCRPTADGGVNLEIVDDGPGLPIGFDPTTDGGFGFKLLRALSKQLDARMILESGAEGLRFEIMLQGESDTST
jgi:two-component sensor histidine kinase